MKRTVMAVAALLLMGLWVYFSMGREQDMETRPGVPVQEAFDTKIVYTTDMEADTALLAADCRDRGGVFNECGSICAPEESICAEVCAYTCEDIPRGETGETPSDQPPAGEMAPEVDTRGWSNRALEGYGVTHISVHPKGIPTEGLFGRTRPLDFRPPFPISDESTVYVLETGEPFAAMMKPASQMRLRIRDLESRCMRDGREVGPRECDPLTRDDRILRTGSVDREAWRTEKAILGTVRLDSVGDGKGSRST